LKETIYTPDFYDGERNVFIEVAGTRQAYHENKGKYQMMKKTYSRIILEIRQVSGSLIDIDKEVNWENGDT
jgi:hypothetical protein